MTTYLVGPGGLLAVDEGGAATFPLADARGDLVGATDATGAYTPYARPDPFGRGPVPPGRLGFLGAHQRYDTGTALGLVRMGVRLYDTGTGRFLSPDPVEGGSCNDYDYVCADPVNGLDLDGTWCTFGISWGLGKGCRSKRDELRDAFLYALKFLKPGTKSEAVVRLAIGCLGDKKRSVNTCTFAAIEFLTATRVLYGSAFGPLLGTLQKVYGCVNSTLTAAARSMDPASGTIVYPTGRPTCPVFIPRN